MWLYIKSLFMVKDRSISREMVKDDLHRRDASPLQLRRIGRRIARRNKFRAHNTTHVKSKVK